MVAMSFQVVPQTDMEKKVASHITTRSNPGEQVDLSQRVLTKQEFGKRLFALMLEKGMNQSDLARAGGLGRDSISTYIRGRSVPTPQNLERLAAAVGVSSADLYPNYDANAAAIEEPLFQVKQINDGSGMMWLHINMRIDAKKAVEIMQILNA